MLCNVDFFDKNLRNTHHDMIEISTIDDDYLSPQNTTINIGATNKVSIGDFVYFTGDMRYLGIVTTVDNQKFMTTITIRPFLSLFERDVRFNTLWLRNGASLENVIASLIRTNWFNSGDSLQNIPCLNILVGSSQVTNWWLDVSQRENETYTIVPFYEQVIAPALSKYGVSIRVAPHFDTGKINVYISNDAASYIIDADLDNVYVQTFKYKEPNERTNKLDIWNTANDTQRITYYMHPDGTYDTSNTNRISPVVFGVKQTTNEEGYTFDQAAQEVAEEFFSGIEWENLIELSVSRNDTLINPIGQFYGGITQIIHKGVMYRSILTGRKYGDDITMIFGTIRTDWTKRLRMEKK